MDILDVPKWPFGQQKHVPLTLVLQSLGNVVDLCNRAHLEYLLDYKNEGMVSATTFVRVLFAFGPLQLLPKKPRCHAGNYISSAIATWGSYFYGMISEEESKALLNLDGRAGTFLLRLSDTSAKYSTVGHLCVDYLIDGAVAFETIIIKNLGNSYGLRWKRGTVTGDTIEDVLHQVPALQQPLTVSFPKHRYWFGLKSVGYRTWNRAGRDGSYALKFHRKNSTSLELLRYDPKAKRLQALELPLINGRVNVGKLPLMPVENFITLHCKLFTSPVPVQHRTLIYYDTNFDKRRRDLNAQRYFTGTVFFDKALFQDASLVENWEETHIIQSPAKTDSTPMPLLQLPIELLKHIFSYIYEVDNIKNLALVCSTFARISGSNDVWQARYRTCWKLAVLTVTTTSDPSSIDFRKLFFEVIKLNKLRKHTTTDICHEGLQPKSGFLAANVIITSGKWCFGVRVLPDDHGQTRPSIEDELDAMDVVDPLPTLSQSYSSVNFTFGCLCLSQFIHPKRGILASERYAAIKVRNGECITSLSENVRVNIGDTLFCTIDTASATIQFFKNEYEIYMESTSTNDVFTPIIQVASPHKLQFITSKNDIPDTLLREHKPIAGPHLIPFFSAVDVTLAYIAKIP